jgi:hypothetical protein
MARMKTIVEGLARRVSVGEIFRIQISTQRQHNYIIFLVVSLSPSPTCMVMKPPLNSELLRM